MLIELAPEELDLIVDVVDREVIELAATLQEHIDKDRMPETVEEFTSLIADCLRQLQHLDQLGKRMRAICNG
jgi:hypothetical protein